MVWALSGTRFWLPFWYPFGTYFGNDFGTSFGFIFGPFGVNRGGQKTPQKCPKMISKNGSQKAPKTESRKVPKPLYLLSFRHFSGLEPRLQKGAQKEANWLEKGPKYSRNWRSFWRSKKCRNRYIYCHFSVSGEIAKTTFFDVFGSSKVPKRQ